VLIPAGHIFLSGPFDLKSNIQLHVANGATLLANPDENVYTKRAFRENQGEGTVWIGGENRNSAYWTIHLVGCDDVAISDLTLLNNVKVRNSDGIDLDHSKNVRIANCFIESGDDCICLKNRRCRSENAIYVGAESADKVTDIRFYQVDVDINKQIHYALDTHGVMGLEVSGFSGAAAFPDKLDSYERRLIRNRFRVCACNVGLYRDCDNADLLNLAGPL
jgi:hypothetical protein